MGSRPDEGNPISGLPEDWGRIVVPDDASELEELAESVRFELGLAADPGLERQQRRLPLIVIAVTVAIALVSLFTVPWLGRVGQVTPPSPSTSTSVQTTSGDCGPSRSCDPTTTRSGVSS